MKLPDRYPQPLRGIILAHTNHAIIPSWYVVHYLEIAADFQAFFKTLSPAPKRVLDLGGQSLAYLHMYKLEHVILVEPRDDYARAALDLYKNVSVVDMDDVQKRHDYDLLLINMDLGALDDNPVSERLNAQFKTAAPVYSYRYHNSRMPGRGAGFGDDGYLYNAETQKLWQKRITDHMHMGYGTQLYNKVRFFNLTRDY